MIAGNVTTTERIEWNSARQFTFTSEVNELTDRDWVKVWLDKGITYVFRLGGEGAGGILQTRNCPCDRLRESC